MFKFILLATLLLSVISSAALAESEATYNGLTGELDIPKVRILGDPSDTVYSVDMVNSVNGFIITELNSYTSEAPTLTGLSIIGETQVNEFSTLQLQAIAIWSDGTWSDVSSSATWSDNSGALTVDDGIVSTGTVTLNQSANIYASYNSGNTTLDDTKTVAVTDIPTQTLFLEVIALVPDIYGKPLGQFPYDGFDFILGHQIYGISSSMFLQVKTYSELVSAINENISTIPSLANIVTASIGNPFTVYEPSGTLLTGQTIVLSVNSANYFDFFGWTASYNYDSSFHYANSYRGVDPGL